MGGENLYPHKWWCPCARSLIQRVCQSSCRYPPNPHNPPILCCSCGYFLVRQRVRAAAGTENRTAIAEWQGHRLGRSMARLASEGLRPNAVSETGAGILWQTVARHSSSRETELTQACPRKSSQPARWPETNDGADNPARSGFICNPVFIPVGETPKRLRNAVTKWLNDPNPTSKHVNVTPAP